MEVGCGGDEGLGGQVTTVLLGKGRVKKGISGILGVHQEKIWDALNNCYDEADMRICYGPINLDKPTNIFRRLVA